VPLDAADRQVIREEIQRTEDHLSTQLKLVEERIKGHLTDRFAHGWDHQQIGELAEWRQGFDRWRWMVTGALVFVATEVPIVVTVAIAIWGRRP
jgi:hypothetical protein